MTNLAKILSFGGILFICIYIWLNAAPKIKLEKIEEAKEIEKTIAKEASNYDITLHESLFKGVNKDLEPYKLTALKVIKAQDDKYDFEKIKADYFFGGVKLLMEAKEGNLDEKTKWMHLKQGTAISFNEVTLNTSNISVNLYNKDIYSNSISLVKFKDSWLKADNFSSSGDGNIINFKGNVKTCINISDF